MGPAATLLRAATAVYRHGISPFTPVSCRFVPTCSDYAEEAVTRHGARRGGWLALRRLARCHPLGGQGWDPVPDPSGGRGPDDGDRR